jgi:hypothetical protein
VERVVGIGMMVSGAFAQLVQSTITLSGRSIDRFSYISAVQAG